MSYVVITSREREELVELFFKLRKKGELHPHARAEALTALRCLKAVHSNAIEDKKVALREVGMTDFADFR